EEIRCIWPRFRLSVDSAGSEAPRPGRVEHQIFLGFPLCVQAVDVPCALASARYDSPVRSGVGDIVAGDVQSAAARCGWAVWISNRLFAVHRQTAVDAGMRCNCIGLGAEACETVERVFEPVE